MGPPFAFLILTQDTYGLIAIFSKSVGQMLNMLTLSDTEVARTAGRTWVGVTFKEHQCSL